MTAVEIDLTGVSLRAGGIHGWALKKDAVAHLAKLRERGRNVEKCIDIHPARTRLLTFWVIARPDPLSEFTWLMGQDGTWARGRLTDRHDKPATWAPHPASDGAPIPATFTHVTRTVPDTHNRHERYKTKSNGSCGRWVRTDESVALCTCGWKTYTQTRGEAQAAARAHRNSVLPTAVTALADAQRSQGER